MPKERSQNLAETDQRLYYNQEEWVEEFLDDKGAFYSGSESDDCNNDSDNCNENMEAVIRRYSSKQVFLKICKFPGKIPVLEFLYNKVAGSKACNFNKNRLQHRCFPMRFANFTSFYRTPLVTASEKNEQQQLFEGFCQQLLKTIFANSFTRTN